MSVPVAEELLIVESADRTPIACWCTGTGPPLVLVHGTGEDHRRWRLITSHLARRYTVYALDRRGRPASGDVEPYALSAEADDIAAVVDQFGPGVLLLAHSYGAICAVEAATRGTGLAGLILYEPPIPVDGSRDFSAVATRLRGLVAEGQEEQALGEFLTEVAGVPRETVFGLRSAGGFGDRRSLAGTLAREIEATHRYVWRPSRFTALATPVLLLAGGQSPAPVWDAVTAVDDALPNSRIAVLEGQGHCAMDTDHRMFLDVVLGFLRERIR